jgi:biopolymer transport protein ExbB/TolQ
VFFMEGFEVQSAALVAAMVGLALAIPATAIALHQRRRRSFERRAGRRRKEKIRL